MSKGTISTDWIGWEKGAGRLSEAARDALAHLQSQEQGSLTQSLQAYCQRCVFPLAECYGGAWHLEQVIGGGTVTHTLVCGEERIPLTDLPDSLQEMVSRVRRSRATSETA